MTTPAVPVPKDGDIKALIQSDAGKRQFAVALPKSIKADHFVRVVLTAFNKNPKLTIVDGAQGVGRWPDRVVHRMAGQHGAACPIGHQIQNRGHAVDLQRDLGAAADIGHFGLDLHADRVRPAGYHQR